MPEHEQIPGESDREETARISRSEAPVGHGSDRGIEVGPNEAERSAAFQRHAEEHLRQLRQPPPYVPPPPPQRFRSRVDFEAAHGGKAFPVTDNRMTPILVCPDGRGWFHENGGGTTYREESEPIKIAINRLSYCRVRLKQAQDALNAYGHERWAGAQNAAHTYHGGRQQWSRDLLGDPPLDEHGQLTLAECIRRCEFLVSCRRYKVARAEEGLARVAPHLEPAAAARLRREDDAAMARFMAEQHSRHQAGAATPEET
jgi:hypothetical protein